VQVESPAAGEWVAFEGKALRGSWGEQGVFARTPQSGDILAHQPLTGPKASEVPTVRSLLTQPSLQGRKVTLDAGHCNPTTTAQIHQARGGYLVQLKANQSTVLAAVHALAATAAPLGSQSSVDKAPGRLEERHATFFSLAALPLPPRWQATGLCSVVRVTRTTTQLKTAKQSQAVAYYVTNQAAATPAAQDDLVTAIQGHWGCEADHWRRDVTLQEDLIHVTQPTQAHGLGVLRTLVLRVFRCVGAPNYQALIETLADSSARFKQLLCQVGFL
jgi:predicted transposase YbfD/YdcC